tara:strand:- start:11000 stop:12385 length:1386 start_codon:yes stop_codon:yes gene_type:complete
LNKIIARETIDSNFKNKFNNILKKILVLPPMYRLVNLITIYKINSLTKNSMNRILCVGDPDDRMKFLKIEAEENFDYQFIWFPRRVVDWLFKKYIVIEKEVGLGEWSLSDYYNPDYLDQNKRQVLRKKYSKLISDSIKFFNVQCLILPKLNDDWIVDFQLAAKNNNLPIVVNDRESSISPKRMEIYPKQLIEFKNDLNTADYICVNNDMHKEFFIKSGIDQNKLVLTGSPQSDIWNTNRESAQVNGLLSKIDITKKNILYLGFGVRTYLNFYYKNESRTWDEFCKDVHNKLANFIIKNKETVNVLYKIGSKPARDYWHGFDNFYEKLVSNGAEDSLIQVRGKILTPELLPFVDLTISFQTTGVVEAMFEDTPIIYVGWGDLYESIKDTLFDFENSGVHYASSKEIFEEMLESFSKNKLPDMDRSNFEKWKYDFFYKSDGKASKRILECVEKTLTQQMKKLK